MWERSGCIRSQIFNYYFYVIKNFKRMNKINYCLAFVLTLILGLTVHCHTIAQKYVYYDRENIIEFPDIPGYKTLKCDFHQHSVFSDGHVWPDIRVAEAIEHGLDAIAITDHLEYQPYKEDIPHPDRNRSYMIALEAAEDTGIIVINGAEITRDMPPGHLNAIFLKDVNKLLTDSVYNVLSVAEKQGAFIFWNHPHWIAHKKDGIAELSDMHRKFIKEGLIDGIEIVSWTTYSGEALQIAIDNNLTIIGSSDIHGLIDMEYKALEEGHRPVTLVFARENTKEAIKEALENRRTAVWFKNTLIGKPQFIVPLIQESLMVKNTEVLECYTGKSFVVSVYIENISDMDYILENQKDFGLHSHADILTAKAHRITNIQVRTLEELSNFDLRFKVLNAITAPDNHPEITLNINVDWD